MKFHENLTQTAHNDSLLGHKISSLSNEKCDLWKYFCEPHFFENNKNAHISKTAGFRALILCSIDSAGPILGGSPHMHFSPTPSPFELSAIYSLEARGGKGS